MTDIQNEAAPCVQSTNRKTKNGIARLHAVAYVVNTFPLPSETFIADEALSLFDQGIQVCMLHINQGNLDKVHPSAQSLLKRAKLFKLGAASKLDSGVALLQLFGRSPKHTLRVLRTMLLHPQRWCYIQALPAAIWCLRERVGFLHAHFAEVNFIYASAISAWSGIPFGVTTHRFDIFEEPIDRHVVTDLFKCANIVVTISEYNRLHMVQKYGLPSSKINIVHCGVDLNRFIFKPRLIRHAGQPLRIINVGRLVPEKAQDVLLRAVSILKDHQLPFILEIIGDGPLSNQLHDVVNHLGLEDSVVFHGAKTQDFVIDRLAAADLFVLSSRAEGLPVVCMEALAAGTPLIATRIFGIPEMIEHEVNGLLVTPDEPQALADAVIRAHADPNMMANLAIAGRQTVIAEFERNTCTQRLIQLWANAASNNKL